MKLKAFLNENKIIKESALAILMWPDKKNQAKVFSNKINEVATGKNGSKQRITENDESRAKVVLLEVAERIKKFAGNNHTEITRTEDVQPKKEVAIKKVIEKVRKEPTMAELLKESLKKEPGATK